MFLFIVPSAYAGLDSIGRVHQDLEEGLPSNNVYSIMQDHNGYIWYCTDNGVVKYNGYSYRVFTTNDGLPSSDVWKLYEDKYGRIWFYCYSNEIAYLKNDICYKIKIKFPQIRMFSNIWEEDGDVVIESPINNYFSFCRIDSAGNENEISIAKSHWPILHSAMDGKYVVNINGILYDVQTNGYKLIYKKISALATYINRIAPTSNTYYVKNGLIANVENGWNKILTYNLYTFKSDSFLLKNLGGDEREKIYTPDFVDTTVLFYTDKAVYTFNSSLKFLSRQSFTGIVNKTVQVAQYYKDKTGNVWLSTSTAGAYMLPKYKLSLRTDTILNTLFQPKCIGILKDGTECWWSDQDKHLLMLDLEGKVRFSADYDDRLLKVSNLGNKLWFFFVHSIKEYDPVTKEYRSFLENRHLYLKGKLSTFEKVRYTGYNFTGMARMYDSIAPQVFYDIIDVAQYAPSKFLYSASFRNVDALDITDTAVYVTRIADGRYPNYLVDSVTHTTLFYNKKGILLINNDNLQSKLFGDKLLALLHSHTILGIYNDNYNNIYLHLDNKLVVYNTTKRWLTEIPVNIKLTDANICVYKNMLIISGNFGLAYIKIKGRLAFGDLHIVPNVKGTWYNRVYQMVVNQVGDVSLITDKGAYSYKVDSMIRKGATFNGRNNDVINLVLNTPYVKHVDAMDTVSIASGLQSISFDLINYYGSGNRYFVYKIDNVTPWQKTTTGEILITDLSPGVYYTVKCYVVDEMWESKAFTFYLYKQPKWYETVIWIRAFWVLGVFLTIFLIGLIVLVTRFYVNQSNEKKSRLLDLELRAVYSQINPHFIFNTLSSALFFISKKQFDEAYTHVSKFSKLLRSYLKSSQERYCSLAEEVDMLRNYIELQQIRFEKKFSYKITVDNKIPAENLKIPSLLLQPLVENAINHGLFHKQNEGQLNISFLQGKTNNELICLIEDNGVGRLRASEINKESTIKHDSYGTRLTQKLIQIFKEYEHMNIYLEYTDKKPPEMGTIVKLILRNLKYEYNA